MKKYVSKLILDEEGSGLILALMTLMVLAVLGASLGAITIGSHRLGAVNRDDTSAYYIAEAGANQAFEEIKGHVYDAHESTSGQSSFFDRVEELSKPYFEGQSIKDFSSQFGDSPESLVTLEKVDNNDNTVSYKIFSKGVVDGKERQVEKQFEVVYSEATQMIPALIENASVITRNDVKLHHNFNQVTGRQIVIRDDNEWKNYSELLNVFPEKDIFELRSNIKSNNPHTIFTEENELLNIRVNRLNLDYLTIEGDGIVNIYIDDELLFGNNYFIGHNPSKVRLFYSGKESLKLDRKFKFNGLLFNKEADITIGERGNFNGLLVSGGNNINFENPGRHVNEFYGHIIAPQAHIKIANHVNVYGSIISNSLDIGNHGQIRPYSYLSDEFDFNTEKTSQSLEINSTPIIEPK